MPRALIVDDEEDMRALVKAAITAANEGLLVSGEAATGAAGLALWREQRPEVIVLDQRMPDVSGLEVAEIILAEDPDQCIILFSAYLTPEMERSALELGIRECMAKSDWRDIPMALWRCVPGGRSGQAAG